MYVITIHNQFTFNNVVLINVEKEFIQLLFVFPGYSRFSLKTRTSACVAAYCTQYLTKFNISKFKLFYT